jgi:hypothetical protein
MRPLAHHLGEDSLVNLVLVGGSGLTLILVEGRARLAAIRTSLIRRWRGTPPSRAGNERSTGTG